MKSRAKTPVLMNSRPGAPVMEESENDQERQGDACMCGAKSKK